MNKNTDSTVKAQTDDKILVPLIIPETSSPLNNKVISRLVTVQPTLSVAY